MGSRIELQSLLETLLGSKNVYFQAPPSAEMKYPCIIYERNSVKSDFANDAVYNYRKSYSVTIIDANPDSDIPDKLLKLPLCSFERHYKADNLNHDVYNLYY